MKQLPYLVALLFTIACSGKSSSDDTPPASGGSSNAGSGGGTPLVGGAPGTGGTSGSGGSSDTGGASGSGGSSGSGGASNGEYVDEEGRCRRDFEDGIFDCPASYDEALLLESPCGSLCAGPVGDRLVHLRSCTPTRGCAYDRTTRLLVGGYYGDDVADHCDRTSFGVVAGDYPEPEAFNGYDVAQNCPGSSDRSVAPLFSELFAARYLRGVPCRSGRDECRGPVQLLVCANAAGEIAGDGTCKTCSSDAECQAEYAYAGAEMVCNDNGLCDFSGALIGACAAGATSACRTADGAYVCHDGVCDRCTDSAECEATGPGELDVCQAGQCLRSEAPPP